jgi:dihydroorotase
MRKEYSLKKMDQFLLKNAEWVGGTADTRQRVDIVIRNGKIKTIGEIDADSFKGEVFDLQGRVLMPGLIDMHVHLREPGREDEETIVSGCAAAMAGGFTAVCAMPNTDPPCDRQEVVEFIRRQARDQLVDVHPIATLTKGRQGQEITEMADLLAAGAVAFSDDGSAVSDSSVLRRAMEYASMYDALVIEHCEEASLAEDGHMNESIMSTRLGMAGIPNAAEEIVVMRDISLARLTGARLHIAHISTREAVEWVRRAKAEGLPVSCEVTPHHLMFTDEDLTHYDTSLKMNPPLRSRKDVEALHAGLKDGTIDVIASDHAPHSVEEKDVEFQAAPFGITGLETLLGVVMKHVVQAGTLSLEQVVTKLSGVPRELLHLDTPVLKEGAMANFTIIDPQHEWTVDRQTQKSKSRNMPYHGMTFPGKGVAVINKGMIYLAG